MTVKRHATTLLLAGSAAAALIGVWSLGLLGPRTHAPSPERAMGKPAISRLIRVSGAQYQQIIADVFGPTILPADNPNQGEARIGGLLAVGAAQVSYSSAGFASAHDMAEHIAQQVTSPTNRATLLPCRPGNDRQPADACAEQFFAKAGRLLWRRALTPSELASQVQVAHAGAEKLKDFYAGVQESLAGLLTSPNFLFRVQQAQAVSGHPGVYELTAYSKASRLAAMLWNSNPDSALLTAAETGELDSAKGLAAQVDRMLASPRTENGVRAFFSDMLEFDKFAALDKDPTIYPRYTPTVGKDMQESLLRVLVDELLVNRVSYPQLFRARETYLTAPLAALIDVQLPLPRGASNGAPGQEWVKYEFPANDPRAGLLTMPAFTALNAHPGKSSPTLRGKAIRENLLCQKIPDPPAGVSFDLFNSDKAGPTARDRLTVHRTAASCAGCHKLMDPLGLSLENLDGSGSWRTQENGTPINASGEFENTKYTNADGLNEAVGGSQAAESCLINRIYSYGTARAATSADRAVLKTLEQSFEQHGRQFPELLKLIANSPEFYEMTAPKGFGTEAAQQLQASARTP